MVLLLLTLYDTSAFSITSRRGFLYFKPFFQVSANLAEFIENVMRVC